MSSSSVFYEERTEEFCICGKLQIEDELTVRCSKHVSTKKPIFNKERNIELKNISNKQKKISKIRKNYRFITSRNGTLKNKICIYDFRASRNNYREVLLLSERSVATFRQQTSRFPLQHSAYQCYISFDICSLISNVFLYSMYRL